MNYANYIAIELLNDPKIEGEKCRKGGFLSQKRGGK